MPPLPDVRDGLTPVSRAILEMLLARRGHWTRATEMLRQIVGGHVPSLDAGLIAASRGAPPSDPHLDAYLALVEMVQPFRMRYPLVDGQGNFGSLDGERPVDAAFTQARILPIGEATLRGVFPNLAANGAGNRLGSTQAGVLPHHLGEILDAARALVRDPELSDDALLDRVPGPDFPTGGVIPRPADARAVDRTGDGTLTVRARMHAEVVDAATVLVVSEMPFGVPTSRIVEKTSNLLRAGHVEGVADLMDESDAGGVRLVFVLSRQADTAAVEARLLRDTSLEVALDVRMQASSEGDVVRVTLPSLIRSYVRSCLARAGVETGGGPPERIAEHALRELEHTATAYADVRRTQVG